MAGNIVKWWKHKILGGYKQFSVQECTTDSEELMYHQVRASSSCSAPPDLLLVSDRENNIPLRSPVVNIITTTTHTNANGGSSNGVGNNSAQKQQTQQLLQHPHQQQQQQHGTKEATSRHIKMSSKNNSSKLVNNTQQQQQQQQHEDAVAAEAQQQQQQQQQHSQYQRHTAHQSHGKEERIRLEEFTCDVSVEGGKSTQPLQFSFTFYDLDGHHGKITKDDIVGIVYTIYESIGKSVVVPHCGSKTINVRLTVSPEGKSKAAAAAVSSKLKKLPAAAMLEHTKAGGGSGGGLPTTSAAHGHTHASVGGAGGGGHTRRQHRYRPRKLIKSDDEDDDSNSDKEKEMSGAVVGGDVVAGKSKSHASKYNKMKAEQQQQPCCTRPQDAEELAATTANNCQHDSLYENMTATTTTTNLKTCCTKEAILLKKCETPTGTAVEECRSCEVTTSTTAATITGHQHGSGHGRSPTDVYMKQASTRVKMLRKARKQKYQDHCLETRQRSLSVGNEACWKNRHAALQQQQQQQLLKGTQPQQEQQQLGDVVDGVQLRNPQRNVNTTSEAAMMSAAAAMAHKRNSAECWKTALNRNDLISIIRESMEKNRLCFQMNGKPQANVSPIRQPQHQHPPPLSQCQQQQQQQQQPPQQHQQQHQHRQRSNTVSKIPTLIANHNNSIISHTPNTNTNINTTNNTTINNTNNSNSSAHSHSPTNNNNNDLSIIQQQQQQLQPPQHDNSNNSNNSSLYHPQPHIPIYHQQMAINPAIIAAAAAAGQHSKINLCGYDSFLHATICGGGTSHSPPPTVSNAAPISHQPTNKHGTSYQPIATVQPIMTAVAQPSVPNMPHAAKVFANSTANQIKTSKILRSGSYTQAQQHQQPASQQNSPQYHGYQRLSSSLVSSAGGGAHQHHHHLQASKQLHALNLHNLNTADNCANARDKCQKYHGKRDLKHYDNSLYAKLSEKLQESTLNAEQYNKENWQRRRHKAHKRQPATPRNSSSSQASKTTRHDYIALIPINGDPLECENLLGGQTTDDDVSNELATTPDAGTQTTAQKLLDLHVATDTLIDLNDDELGNAVVESSIKTAANELLLADKPLASNGEAQAAVAAQEELEAGEMESGSASPTNALGNTSLTSSLIHRYVHEHIHHHYHHFEEKDE